jgi:hypothetical protein
MDKKICRVLTFRKRNYERGLNITSFNNFYEWGPELSIHISMCIVIHLPITVMSFSFPILMHLTAWIKCIALAWPANMY